MKKILSQVRLTPPVIALLLSVVLYTAKIIIQPGSGTFDLAISVLMVAAFLGIFSAGQTLVVISGGEGIDLSTGAMITLGAIISYAVINGSNDMIIPGLLVTLAAGAVIGFLNGIGIAYLRVPPLVMTLGMTGVVTGLVRAVTQGELFGRSAPLMNLVKTPVLFGLPGVVFLWLGVGALMWLLLERTRFGKNLFAIGVNRATAMLSGVNVKGTIIGAYTLSSMLAAFGGFVYLGYIELVFLNVGDRYTLPTVAATVMGGTLLSGGTGSYWGTMAGAIVLTLIDSLLGSFNIPEHARQIIYGVILLVLLAAYGRSKSLRQ